MAQQQLYPTTFPQLQDALFESCEDFISAARRIAASESVSLTITHKSRNSPGKAATQYRGCLVLNCLQWEHGCTFEIKAYGPVDGGWRMRPLQHPGLKKHTVTSWCICNHPKAPLRSLPVPQISSWAELVTLPFVMPDDLIAAAMRVASIHALNLYLLTLMISDGKPKPNGRNSMYVPRGFLTLECVEAGNGCPFAIKAREEADGWYMRPWREKGKGDLKGAVSVLACKHGPEVQQAYLQKLENKARKVKKPKASKKDDDDDSLQDPESPEQMHHHQQQQQHPQDIPSGLDPVLADHSSRGYDPHQTLSQAQILGHIEQTLSATNPAYPSSMPDPRYSNGYGAEHFHQQHQQHHPIASTSASVYTGSPVSNLDPFRSNLGGYGDTSPLPASALKRLHAPPSTAESRAPKRVRARPSMAAGSANGNTPISNGHGNNKLNKSWKGFLTALDPAGRLAQLNGVLADGGIDPGAVVIWPEEDVREFVDSVGPEVPSGVKIHFRVLLLSDGKRVWNDLQRRQE